MSTLNVTNIKAADGTSGLSIANSTGVVTATKEIVNSDYILDNWRINNNFNPNGLGLTGNTVVDRYWERFTRTGTAQIGTQMQEASGVFTFPKTGLYLVKFNANMSVATGAADEIIYIETTTNNSTYIKMAISQFGGVSGGASDNSVICETLVNVTDVTNVKVRFRVDGFESATELHGAANSSAANGFARTQVFFERKGPSQ